MSGGRSSLLRGLHLAALWAFAVAQPLFDVLADTPEFFVARGSRRWDVIAFAMGVILLPPAALLLVEVLAGLAHARIRDGLHLLLVAGLAAMIALQALKRAGRPPASAALLGAAALGLAAAFLYGKRGGVRLFLTVLAPAPFLFLGLFLLQSPVSKLVLSSEAHASAVASVSAKTPIVMVVFDELPLTSLMNARRAIDGSLYPNFAALARQSTWFRNATSINDDTLKAVPAILTGNYPRPGRLPLASDHPRNLFTLLGRSYRLEVFEPVTHLCPDDLCGEKRAEPFFARMRLLVSDLSVIYLHVLLPVELSARLPSVTEKWMDFLGAEQPRTKASRLDSSRFADSLVRQLRSRDRHLQFERFVASISRSDRQPTLYFLHILLPHTRWRYLPSGKQYANADVPFALVGDRWSDDEWLVTQAFQRHLLQVEFVDRLLGELLARLRAAGLYDRSLIVVTADHGISFRPDEPPRDVSETTVDEIGPVPLFIKAPDQRKGRIADRYVETTDILPTIADVIGVRLPWATDGHSAFDTSRPERRAVVIFGRAGRSFVVDGASLQTKKYAALARKIAIFGSGKGQLGLFGIGPHPELLGRPVQGTPGLEKAGVKVLLDNEDLFRSVDLESEVVPAQITGRIIGYGVGKGRGLPLAIAVNGRIAAVTRSFLLPGSTRFAALVPEAAFRQGRNEVEVFLVSGG